MKFWVSSRYLPYNTNNNWAISSYALHFRRVLSIFLRCPHLPGRKLWMTTSKYSRKHCIFLFPLYLLSYRSGYLLWLLRKQRNLKNWSNTISFNYVNCFRRLCSSMRTNVFLRCYCNYQPYFRRTLHRNLYCPMSLGWFFSR